ncbi:MAG TPA: DUF177 domain-containing protein [Thermoleophilaceae bacterium]|nr:DUF177 domain-containing protein [Thermoleophilaceae bacterium]
MGGTRNTVDLARLGLASGEGVVVEAAVDLDSIELAGQRYASAAGVPQARVDISRTTAGYALRLRYTVTLEGPCMRCLEAATEAIAVDAREVDQPGGGDDLRSPYLDGDELDLHSWVRDALVLALPTQIRCAAECRGLCAICGANLNDDPEHAHESAPDARWAKLSEIRFD